MKSPITSSVKADVEERRLHELPVLRAQGGDRRGPGAHQGLYARPHHAIQRARIVRQVAQDRAGREPDDAFGAPRAEGVLVDDTGDVGEERSVGGGDARQGHA